MSLRNEILKVIRDSSRTDRYLERRGSQDENGDWVFLTTRNLAAQQFKVETSYAVAETDDEKLVDFVLDRATEFFWSADKPWVTA